MVLHYLVIVLNELIFEMSEKLKEVRVTSAYSHVGLPTQVVPPSLLLLMLHLHTANRCFVYVI